MFWVSDIHNIFIGVSGFSSVHFKIFVLINFFKIVSIWTIFKVFIEPVTILLLFYVFAFWIPGMCGLSSPTRD